MLHTHAYAVVSQRWTQQKMTQGKKALKSVLRECKGAKVQLFPTVCDLIKGLSRTLFFVFWTGQLQSKMGSCSLLLHFHSQPSTCGSSSLTSHVLCRWPPYTRGGWSVRCAGAQAQQSGTGNFWSSDSPDEAFVLSPTATVLM